MADIFQAKDRVDDVKEDEAIHYVDGPHEEKVEKVQEKRELPNVEEVIKVEEVKEPFQPGHFPELFICIIC